MPKRRALKILLFPILASAFLIGYVLAYISESRAKVTPTKTTKPTFKQDISTESYLEIGLIEELTETIAK